MVWEDIPGRVYSIAAFVIVFVLTFIGALIASCIKLWTARCKPTTAENEAANTTAQIGPYNTVQSGPYNTVQSGPYNTVQSGPYNTVHSGPYNTVQSGPYNTVQIGPYNTVQSGPYNTAQIGPYNTVQSGAVVNTVDSGAVNTAQPSCAEKALQLQAYVSENRSQYLVCVVFTVWSDNRWLHQPTNWQYREQGLKCSPHQPST